MSSESLRKIIKQADQVVQATSTSITSSSAHRTACSRGKSRQRMGPTLSAPNAMSLSSRSSIFWSLRRQKSRGPKAARRRVKHLSYRNFHPIGASSGRMSGRRGLARMYSHFAGSSRRPQSSSLEAGEEGLCGFVETADGPVVEVEGCHVQQTVDGSFRNGSVEAKGELLFYSVFSPDRTGRSCRSSRTRHSTMAAKMITKIIRKKIGNRTQTKLPEKFKCFQGR